MTAALTMLARVRTRWVAALMLLPTAVCAQALPLEKIPQPLSFRVTFDPAVRSDAYSGRVYVIVSDHLQREPRGFINNAFAPPHLFAVDVSGANPAKPIVVGNGALANFGNLAELPPGEYRVQAVARCSLDHPIPGHGPGDLYSDPQNLSLYPKSSGSVELRLVRVVEERPFEETERAKLVEMVSPSLSRFHGREVKIRAGVVLPVGWIDDPSIRWPVIYSVPGFGGNHRYATWFARGMPAGHAANKVMLVVPDPNCHRGHSVFADSDNNGPWGQALVEELIPRIEAKFHGAQSGKHRYVTGVSSGGWSALWLQITYPDSFNGCWAHVPDPVDFRDFQQIDLYKSGINMYTDETGGRRPIARQNDKVLRYYDDFVRLEDVVGPGGQIHSFEACFSPKGADGKPRPLFDHKTGRVDTKVARTWERYDIRLVLERNWSTLSSKLAGKLHIFAGGKDTFYLDGAVELLKKSLDKIGSDAEVVISPEMGHARYREADDPMYRTILDNFRSKSQAAPAESKGKHP